MLREILRVLRANAKEFGAALITVSFVGMIADGVLWRGAHVLVFVLPLVVGGLMYRVAR